MRLIFLRRTIVNGEQREAGAVIDYDGELAEALLRTGVAVPEDS